MDNSKITTTEHLTKVAIRFAGDSGDGMQLTGERFTTTSAIMGEEVATLTDFPAEIRAPQGTVSGVSGFQLAFGSDEIYTAGDAVDTLVAMNPAALKKNLFHLKKKGILIINKDAFDERNIEKAGFESDPRTDNSLSDYQVVEVPITTMTKEALKESGLKPKDVRRCKNFFALGITFWLYKRDIKPTEKWLEVKFAKRPELAQANKTVMKAGWTFGDASELFAHSYEIDHTGKERGKGTYRHVTGNKALVLGLVTAGHKAGRPVYYSGYPITPASDILHGLSDLKHMGVITFQAEDEMAAVGSAIGASYSGAIGVTASSGPGIALKSEFINLAMITELPLVVIDVQRGGPSTGLPTKTEQTDLMQAIHGRNGESPVIVLAASSPTDCFEMAFEAVRLAVKYMTPVILLSDNYLANGSQVWKVPDANDFPEIKPVIDVEKLDMENFSPFMRDEKTLARPWVTPGVAGGEHRLGGLEKQPVTGNVSFAPEDHVKMTELREEKIKGAANDFPALEVYGDETADVLVLGWGSTYGAIRWAVDNLNKTGQKVAATHLKYINPLPNDLRGIMDNYSKILIPENNTGQLYEFLGGEFNKKLVKYNKISGDPFKEAEIQDKIISVIEGSH